jgi:hypothetical protein
VPLRPGKLRLNTLSEAEPDGGACPIAAHGPQAGLEHPHAGHQDVDVRVDERVIWSRPLEQLELHAGHRPGRVLPEGLIDSQPDLVSRTELAPREVLLQNRARQRGHAGSIPDRPHIDFLSSK